MFDGAKASEVLPPTLPRDLGAQAGKSYGPKPLKYEAFCGARGQN